MTDKVERAGASTGGAQPSTPEQFSKDYGSLREVPEDVLASRIVGQLILQKGDLVKYAGVIEGFIRRYRAELAGVERTPPTQEELQQRVRDLERTFELLSTERDEWRELSARWETAAWAADNKLRELEQRQAGSAPQPDALPRRYSLGGTGWFTVENESLNFYTGDGRFSHRISADRYHIAIASLAPEAPQVEAGRMSGSAEKGPN